MRGKFRNSLDRPEPFVPGQPTRVQFIVSDTFHTFRRGHRIMLQIQSSWFPLINLNPHKFLNINEATEGDFQKAGAARLSLTLSLFSNQAGNPAPLPGGITCLRRLRIGFTGKYRRVSMSLRWPIWLTFRLALSPHFPPARDLLKSFEPTNGASRVAFQPIFTLTFVVVGF